MLWYSLVIEVVWGVITAQVAKGSGSSRATGFAWGFFLGVIGLGVVFYKAHRRNKRLAAAAA
ncbi:MAG TPA: hypothetical protein VGL44_12650 [Gaiellales bacterium]|jgi:hypothetical protein